MKKTNPFDFGRVVLPAQDGLLSQLGHDVSKLGERALGIVAESRPDKAFIIFPEIQTSIWLDHIELADVLFEAEKGTAGFKDIAPNMSFDVWLISTICKELGCHMILNFELGVFGEVYDGERVMNIAKDTLCTKWGLGLEELFLDQWHVWQERLGPRLLAPRFLPAGMHKLELQLYLKK